MGGAPKRILMVDDDPDLPAALRNALVASLRCEVHISSAPAEAFELALRNEYDLFLFDFSMPLIDGAILYFLLGKVYNLNTPPRILPPLILVTGKGEERRARDLLGQPGFAGIVGKPFQLNRLIGKIAASVPGIEMV